MGEGLCYVTHLTHISRISRNALHCLYPAYPHRFIDKESCPLSEMARTRGRSGEQKPAEEEHATAVKGKRQRKHDGDEAAADDSQQAQDMSAFIANLAAVLKARSKSTKRWKVR